MTDQNGSTPATKEHFIKPILNKKPTPKDLPNHLAPPKSRWKIYRYRTLGRLPDTVNGGKAIAELDVAHMDLLLKVCRIRQMRYPTKDVFLVPYHFDSKKNKCVPSIRFVCDRAAAEFQKELAIVVTDFIERMEFDVMLTPHFVGEPQKKVNWKKKKSPAKEVNRPTISRRCKAQQKISPLEE